MDTPNDIPVEISEDAVKAADCFVDYCLQQAAYLGDRGDFETTNITLKYEITLNDNSLRMVLCMCVCKDGIIDSISDIYYRDRWLNPWDVLGYTRESWDTQTRGIGVSILGSSWDVCGY